MDDWEAQVDGLMVVLGGWAAEAHHHAGLAVAVAGVGEGEVGKKRDV